MLKKEIAVDVEVAVKGIPTCSQSITLAGWSVWVNETQMVTVRVGHTAVGTTVVANGGMPALKRRGGRQMAPDGDLPGERRLVIAVVARQRERQRYFFLITRPATVCEIPPSMLPFISISLAAGSLGGPRRPAQAADRWSARSAVQLVVGGEVGECCVWWGCVEGCGGWV
jgi:hypothetical protein